jgi:hypothetical protein
MEKSRVNLTILFETVCFIFLIWWYLSSPRYGYFETPYIDFIALGITGLFILILMFRCIRLFFAKNKKLQLLILPLLWLLIFFDVFKSPVVFCHQLTDFSVTECIRLRKNGTYDFLCAGDGFAYQKQGRYICRNDSVLVSENDHCNKDTALKTLSAGNTVVFSGFGYIQTHKIKETDKNYSKLKLIKWGWLR